MEDFQLIAQAGFPGLSQAFESRKPMMLAWRYKDRMKLTATYAYLAFAVKSMAAPGLESPGRYKISGLVNAPGFQGTLEFCVDSTTGTIIPETTVFTPSEGV